MRGFAFLLLFLCFLGIKSESYKSPIPARPGFALTNSDLGRGWAGSYEFDPSAKLKPKVLSNFEVEEYPQKFTEYVSERVETHDHFNDRMNYGFSVSVAMLSGGFTYIDNETRDSKIDNIVVTRFESNKVSSAVGQYTVTDDVKKLISNSVELEKKYGTHVLTSIVYGTHIMGHFQFMSENTHREKKIEFSGKLDLIIKKIEYKMTIANIGGSSSNLAEGSYTINSAGTSNVGVKTSDLDSALEAFNKQQMGDPNAMHLIAYEVVPLTTILNLVSMQEFQLRRNLFDFTNSKTRRRNLYSTESLAQLPALKRAEKDEMILKMERTLGHYFQWERDLKDTNARLDDKYLGQFILPLKTRMSQFVNILNFWEEEYVTILKDPELNITEVTLLQNDTEILHLENIYLGLKGLGYIECEDQNWKYEGYIADGYPILEGTWWDYGNYHDQFGNDTKHILLGHPSNSSCDFSDYNFYEDYKKVSKNYCSVNFNFNFYHKFEYNLTYMSNHSAPNSGYVDAKGYEASQVDMDVEMCGGKTYKECDLDRNCHWYSCSCRRYYEAAEMSKLDLNPVIYPCADYKNKYSCVLVGCEWENYCHEKQQKVEEVS